ncbi:unnamed protein product, partial [Didymodactylos carnosus]
MYRHIAQEFQAILEDNPQVRKEVIRRLLTLNNQEQSPEKSTRKRLKRNIGSSSSQSSSSNSRQLQIDQFSARLIPLQEKQEIDRSLLRAFIMCGISFQTASNIFFNEFLNKLNSMYVPPDRMKLSRDLLIQETILVESKNDEMLNETQHLTLNIDGWTDQAGHSLYEYNVVPHAVMPERLFSMLDWQNTKRRTKLNPFTLESVSNIYTYHKNAFNTESPIDMEKIEECLMDELKATTGKSPTTTTNVLSNSLQTFMRTVDENQRILCELAGTDKIDEQNIEDKDLLDL